MTQSFEPWIQASLWCGVHAQCYASQVSLNSVHLLIQHSVLCRTPWRVGDALIGTGNTGWTTSKGGHPCPCQNSSQRPPAENTGRESLRNHLSCLFDYPTGQRTGLNYAISIPSWWHRRSVGRDKCNLDIETHRLHKSWPKQLRNTAPQRSWSLDFNILSTPGSPRDNPEEGSSQKLRTCYSNKSSPLVL